MEGKLYLNGVEVKRTESFEITNDCMEINFSISNEDKSKGELNISLEPNWLWKRKLSTGIPKNIYIPPYI